MPEPQDLMRYQMEDAAMAVYLYPGNELSLASIAISMKRIADAMAPAMFPDPPLRPASPACSEAGNADHDIFDCPICRPF